MDASGSDDKLRVIPDPHQQLIVTKKRPFNIVKGGYKPVCKYYKQTTTSTSEA